MNELQDVESQREILAKLDAAKRELAESTEDLQRIDIRNYAQAVAAESAICGRKDIKVQAANLVMDAERTIAKQTVLNGKIAPKKGLSRSNIWYMHEAHRHFTDEEFEQKKAQALETDIPLTRQYLVDVGKRKHQPTPKIYYGDNLSILSGIPDGSVNLVYTDPPFNTGASQNGHGISYSDDFGDTEAYLDFLRPRFEEVHRVLHPTGSLFFHIDNRESHYCKIMLDKIFGRESFINEIIWAYDFGGRSKKRWAAKHDTIFWYAKNPKCYIFNSDERDRIPYMAPGLVGAEKAAKGKFPTDVWWHTIVPTASSERTGYPTQKPLGVVERIVKVHSNPGDILLDLFAGSGTLGEAAAQNKRRSILIDENPDAIRVMRQRLKDFNIEVINV
jgi:site-specific DNA-methyltransferase (adenine-specific)